MAPAARIIAILREPASFLRSLHLQLVQNRLESERRLGAAISLEPYRRRGERIPRSCYRPQALLYSERVHYAEQLRRFHAAFPAEQVLVLIYEDFRADNESTVRAVQRFLAVDDSVALARSDANPSVSVRSVQIDRVKHALRAGSGPLPRALRAAGRRLTTPGARALGSRAARGLLYGPPGAADEQLMLELRRRFKPEVVQLSEYLGRDLVRWGYDAID